MNLPQIKLEFLLLSRTYANMSNVYFDKWLCGIDITGEEFYSNVMPLLELMVNSSRSCDLELLNELNRLMNEENP